MKKALAPALALGLLSLVFWAAPGARPSGQTPSPQTSDQERGAKNKQTLLSRLRREAVEYRGDGPGHRVKSEWVDKMVRDYVQQKLVIVGESSVGEKYEVSSRWVFKDMKVTFQELFGLGPEDDEKLLPLSYGDELLDLMPTHALEGVTIRGKGAEVKGPYKRSVVITGHALTFANVLGVGLRRPVATFPLYVNDEGKEKLALGVARDAYTVKWKDIKNRVVDDMSDTAHVEKLRLLRDFVSEMDEFKKLH